MPSPALTGRNYVEEYRRRRMRQQISERERELRNRNTPLLRKYRSHGFHGAYEHIRSELYSGDTPIYNPEAKEAKMKLGARVAEALKKDDIRVLVGIPLEHISLDALIGALKNKGWKIGHCWSCNTVQMADELKPTEDGLQVGPCCIKDKYIFSDIQQQLIAKEGTVEVYRSRFSKGIVSSHWARHNAKRHANIMNGAHVEPAYFGQLFMEMQNKQRGLEQGLGFIAGDPGTNPFHPDFGPIRAYHESKKFIHRLPSPVFDKRQVPMLIGMELEIEVGSDHHTVYPARAIKELFNGPDGADHYCCIETDGSIMHGFEVVTGWTGLDVHEKFLSRMGSPEFEKNIRKKYNLKSHDTRTCGLHLTIDRASMTPLHAGKFASFVTSPNVQPQLEAFCRRNTNNYCKAVGDKYKKFSDGYKGVYGQHQRSDRYEILNFSNSYGIEFRLPKGTLRWQTIMATMEMIRMGWFFTQEAAVSALTWEAFMDYIWKNENALDTRYCREYLVERKLCVAPEAAVRVEGKRLSLTESLVDAMAGGFLAKPVEV